MDTKAHIQYWQASAINDLDAAEKLFALKKFDWCLFIGHLVVEKTLKAYFVYTHDNEMPPRTHNLLRLCELSELVLSEEQIIFLDRVNDFNLEARYPSYQSEFYKICTEDFARLYFEKIKDFSTWVNSHIAFKT